MYTIKFTFFSIINFLLLLSIGCENNTSDIVTVKLGYAPIADAAQIFVGMENGYFDKNGIKIQLEQLASGPKILEAVGSGSIQIGLSSYVPFIFARAAGIDFVAITGGAVENNSHREHAYLVRKDSEIRKLEDIEGKVLALNGLRNIDHLIFQELMEKYNIDQSKVRLVEIPFPRMETVLQSGEVDVVAAIEPFVSRATEHGNADILIYNYVELYPKVPVACYAAKESWINDNPDVVKNFLKAFDESTDFCLSNPDSLLTIIGKYTKLTQNELHKIELPTFSKRTDINELQDLIDRMLKRGMIESELFAKDLIYESK